MEVTFEQVLKAALALRPEQKAVLVKTLQATSTSGGAGDPTRAQLIAELETLRAAGAFEHATSLRNQYPVLSLRYVTDQQLLTSIHETSPVSG